MEVLNGASGPETKGLDSKELIEALNGKVAKDGSFVVRGVPPGIYDVHGISARRHLETLKGVRAGTKGHVLLRP